MLKLFKQSINWENNLHKIAKAQIFLQYFWCELRTPSMHEEFLRQRHKTISYSCSLGQLTHSRKKHKK